MIFNPHSNLEGRHAFLSASSYHWLNYDEDKLDRVFLASMAAQRGTMLHDLAHRMIRLGVKLPDNGTTLSSYVNDAIGFKLTPEQSLYYSDNCFGTPDAIGFKRNKLRIHDLKTGVNAASMKQLEVYAALFCLEYRFKPFEIETELRIYQNDDIEILDADPDEIFHIMEKIVFYDKRIDQIRMEELT